MSQENNNNSKAGRRPLATMPNVVCRQQGAEKTVEECFSMGICPPSPISVQHANTQSLMKTVDNAGGRRNRIPACPMVRSAHCKGKSLCNVFENPNLSTTEIMTSLEGHGGTSRMFARGKPRSEDLSSVGRFFSRGATLEKATAFTKSAVAFERNSSLAGFSGRPTQRSRPKTIADELDATNEHPVQEMIFYNIGGAKVFFYYGLDTIRSPEHVMDAGPHVRDTAVGVLMLDQYKIQERPGDPSNPLTFWPYQTFYVIPQGVTFEKCKIVGSAGEQSLRDYPLETSAICQALLAIAEVASKNGYHRLMIVGDCGFYSLAAEALSKSMSCWGSQSWVPHPDGAFASYRVPRFKSHSLDLDIILSLGTTQLISSPEPEKNLSTQLGDDTSVVYLTADLRGWYSAESLKTLEAEYMTFLHRPWNNKSWHFNLDDTSELNMLDLVAQVNHSILAGVLIDDNDYALYKVVDSLLELNAGSTAYLVGLFLGHIASQMEEGGTRAEKAFFGASKLTRMAEEMTQADGKMHPRHTIVEKVKPVFDYLQPILRRCRNVIAGKSAESPLTEEEEFRFLAVLTGNPSLKGRPAPQSYSEFKLELALRVQDTFMSLLTVGRLSPDISGLPLGREYVEFYANFCARLNKNILPKVSRSHAIDGSKFPLFDCRFVPGFGFAVSQGLTVWAVCQNYFWMGTILLRFSEIMQKQGWMGSCTYHLECTELFSFTPFFHEMGLPVVDGVNSLILASRSTDAPMRFVCLKQRNGLPPTPSALVADISSDSVFGASYYRDSSLALRTPTIDSNMYKTCNSLCRELLEADRVRWTTIRLAQPLFEDFELKWGIDSYLLAKPSESIYPAASAIDIPRYVEHGALLLRADYDIPGYVQYAPREDGEREEEDFRSFFGGNLYRDKRVGSETVTYRVTASSSSSFMRNETDSSMTDQDNEHMTGTKKKDENGTKCDRRKSW